MFDAEPLVDTLAGLVVLQSAAGLDGLTSGAMISSSSEVVSSSMTSYSCLSISFGGASLFS